uniref:Putative elongation factor 1-beta2 n=1 Tax=Tabanus bromius TaxID=304241 RepID=A0A0K8TR05_TABBR
MSFGDVKTQKGLEELNTFLADHSYIVGYVPSKADISVFDALGKSPAGDLPHAQRWYRHIASFNAKEKSTWGGQPLPQAAGGKPTVAESKDDDDDVDLFGSDEEEDAEAAKVREQRLAEYNAKKSKKPALIAKSSILLDVKPWDDETDMKVLEEKVRSVEMDGLLWGASKLVPVGYGINKLQICCVIEDDKVSIDLLQETIQEFEDHVQSVDIAAFNKI